MSYYILYVTETRFPKLRLVKEWSADVASGAIETLAQLIRGLKGITQRN